MCACAGSFAVADAEDGERRVVEIDRRADSRDGGSSAKTARHPDDGHAPDHEERREYEDGEHSAGEGGCCSAPSPPYGSKQEGSADH